MTIDRLIDPPDFLLQVIENCQTEQYQRKQAKRPAGDARYFALIHMRLIHSKSDENRAAGDRPILDMFDAVPLWLIPPRCGSLGRFAPGPLKKGKTDRAKNL